MTERKRRSRRYLRISAVAKRFSIHPQTLRLYEREGLIRPRRSAGNTRLYDEDTLERLDVILTLTREMGVNLAGVEVVLNMREQLEALQAEVDRLLEIAAGERRDRRAGVDRRFALEKFVAGLPSDPRKR